MKFKKEIEGLVAAMGAYSIKEGLILTDDMEDEIEVDGKIIIVKTVWKWLLTE